MADVFDDEPVPDASQSVGASVEGPYVVALPDDLARAANNALATDSAAAATYRELAKSIQQAVPSELLSPTTLQQAQEVADFLAKQAMPEGMGTAAAALIEAQKVADYFSEQNALMERIAQATITSAQITAAGLGRSRQAESLLRALRQRGEILDHAANAPSWPSPRKKRTPADFFATTEVIVASRKQLIKEVTRLRTKFGHLHLLWRGQQNAEWGVSSSLTRALENGSRPADEAQLQAAELLHLDHEDTWGIPRFSDQKFLADLQHAGAPTRLIDVTTDPDVATWFAVEPDSSGATEDADARLIIWGRYAIGFKGNMRPALSSATSGGLFWHGWVTEEERQENQWGTGRVLHGWFPAALNDRMRAQRGGFLYDSEPLSDDGILTLFERALDAPWTAKELARATRVLGLPTDPHRRSTPKSDIVPLFSIRIAAEAKHEIRQHLEASGLTEQTIYPDFAGYVGKMARLGGNVVSMPEGSKQRR